MKMRVVFKDAVGHELFSQEWEFPNALRDSDVLSVEFPNCTIAKTNGLAVTVPLEVT